MTTHGRLPSAGRAIVVAAALAVVAVGAGACGGDSERKTTTAATGGASGDPASITTQPSGPACTFSGATDPASGGADALPKLLTDVRVGAHDCYERVTFEVRPQPGEPAGPVGWTAAYEPAPITEDGSGRTVPVKGAAFLVVRLTGSGVDLSQEAAPATYTGPTSLEAAATTRIQQVRRTGDFEGIVTWVIGLDRQRPFHVGTQEDPARVVVDVGD